jgi:hypothetical protein
MEPRLGTTKEKKRMLQSSIGSEGGGQESEAVCNCKTCYTKTIPIQMG